MIKQHVILKIKKNKKSNKNYLTDSKFRLRSIEFVNEDLFVLEVVAFRLIFNDLFIGIVYLCVEFLNIRSLTRLKPVLFCLNTNN